MADVTVTPQKIVQGGSTPTYTGSLATDDTYKVSNSGRTFIHAKKANATDATMTIATTKLVAGLEVADLEVTVPASDDDGVMAGPFPVDVFGETLSITYDNIDGLEHAALYLA